MARPFAGGMMTCRFHRWLPAWSLLCCLALGAVTFLIACIYVFTAGTAQGHRLHPFPGLVAANSRYLMPGVILAAAVTAWAVTRLRRAAIVIELLALATIASAVLAHPRESPAGILNPSIRYGSVVLACIGLLVLFAIAAAIRLGYRRVRRRGLRNRLLAAGLMVAVAGALVAVGQADQRRFNERRYRGGDAALDWLLDHAPARHRVGVAGVWNPILLAPTLPAFGPRFGNYVAYVGPLDRSLLSFYDHRDPFLAAVRRGRYDLLVVGRGVVPMKSPAKQELWLRSAGFVRVVEGDRFTLMRAQPSTPRRI